ncbi:MAG TPA: pseudouridine synthase [Anaerolineaceae bacterium]|nr:pseudouridine synthase [Anaerolineaceae bacterium]
MAEERLQKILARAGFGSRRSCEELIIAGRVRVNGKPAELGGKADAVVDQIVVDGKPIRLETTQTYIALNKPRGVLSDEQEDDLRPSVRNLVPMPGHIFPVGRLDLDSEGLILLTSDGDLANRLTHPRYGHEKEYRVLVAARPDKEQLTIWRRGVVLEDGEKTAPAVVEVESPFGKGAWLRVILHEGKKRQIREVGKTIGLPVVRIIRVRIGSLLLGSLKPGEWRNLTPEEVAALKSQAGKAKSGRIKAASRPKQSGESSRPWRFAEKNRRKMK